jgi:RHS repeat-associated protein
MAIHLSPLHDRQGHVVCLIDPTTGQPVETYRYSAFGEETIYNAQGQQIANSQASNPWRFASKRIDPETGWIYFGRRYYDPEIGRWITPDPLGFVDGPNLYAYLHHNPLNAYDAEGLLGEAYQDFCKPEFSKTYFADNFNNSPQSFGHRPDRSEILSLQDNVLNSGKAFGNGFLRGMEHPLNAGYNSSGVGMFMNYILDPKQSGFNQNGNSGIVIQFCDKAGELCGTWFLLSPVRTCIKTAAEYSCARLGAFIARQKAPQLIAERFVGEGAVLTADALGSSTTGQVIQEEIACVVKGAEQYTKSNLKLGQQMHRAYKRDLAEDPIRIKEFTLPSKKKIDFLDIPNRKIYELKPNNPRSIKLGQKQLQAYKEELRNMPRFKDIEWETVLETY